nr:isoprenylcysteine carboxylmethyltransferase family protein [Anaerolineae bacterium]
MDKTPRKPAGWLFFALAGILLVAMFGLMFVVSSPDSIPLLRYAGWAVWAFGLVLLPMPRIHFMRRGSVQSRKDYTHTTVLVDSGIYAIIRHPQYLGWLLMYPAMMLFTGHWLFVLLGASGMACVLLFTRQEEQRLIERFGDEYRLYMQRVPAMNILLGLVRFLRRKKEGK